MLVPNSFDFSGPIPLKPPGSAWFPQALAPMGRGAVGRSYHHKSRRPKHWCGCFFGWSARDGVSRWSCLQREKERGFSMLTCTQGPGCREKDLLAPDPFCVSLRWHVPPTFGETFEGILKPNTHLALGFLLHTHSAAGRLCHNFKLCCDPGRPNQFLSCFWRSEYGHLPWFWPTCLRFLVSNEKSAPDESIAYFPNRLHPQVSASVLGPSCVPGHVRPNSIVAECDRQFGANNDDDDDVLFFKAHATRICSGIASSRCAAFRSSAARFWTSMAWTKPTSWIHRPGLDHQTFRLPPDVGSVFCSADLWKNSAGSWCPGSRGRPVCERGLRLTSWVPEL